MIVATNQFINGGQGISAGGMSMARIVEAVYEDGVLKPLQKLNLRRPSMLLSWLWVKLKKR